MLSPFHAKLLRSFKPLSHVPSPELCMLSVVFTIIAVACGLWASSRRAKKCRLRLPPGPPGQVLIGNALQVKPSHTWLYYADVAKQYGDVVYFDVFGQPVITLNSFEAIEDLIIKKSALFSGRPYLPMVTELAGWEQLFGLLQANTQWQVSRKLAHQFLAPPSVAGYHSLLDAQARIFTDKLFAESTDFRENFKFTVGRIALGLTYGIVAKDHDDEYVKLADESIIIFGLATQPGRFLVDSFPILKYVPAWMPGAGFKRIGAQWREKIMLNVNAPFEKVKNDMAAGISKPSFVTDALENPITGSNEEIVKWMSASIYAGSVHTTTATIAGFLLNMVRHPEVQTRAQAEIDRIIGTDRLPSLTDREDLPYIGAILKETLRFHPVLPLSVPYTASEDYYYRDWIIPKDSILVASTWSVQRDPVRYPSPDKFIPERFLDGSPNVLDPSHTFFGYGRRICPGQHLADALLWITIATVLATCTVSRAINENGEEIIPAAEYTGGTVCEPVQFPYKIEPRSEPARSLVQEASSA